MHTNKLELVSSQAVGPSALRWQREKSPYGGYGGWLHSHEMNDSAYKPSVSADCLRNIYTSQGFFLPAAGNRWNGEFNNVGSNGNYWSSTPNDENNAYELNFNSNNANWNNNNRNNEQSVRPVR